MREQRLSALLCIGIGRGYNYSAVAIIRHETEIKSYITCPSRSLRCQAPMFTNGNKPSKPVNNSSATRHIQFIPNMASPLSPLNAEQLNARSPMTALRNEKFAPSSRNATPSKMGETPSKHHDEVINWYDPPSSPFMTEAAESRAASHEWRQAVADPEIDAIFEDVDTPAEQAIDERKPTASNAFDMEDDKENMDTSNMQEQPKKALSPLKPRPSVRRSVPSSRPSSRDADSVAMPPPSMKKQSQFSSPVRSSPRKTINVAAETPLPRSRETSYERPEERGRQFDECIGQDVDTTFAGAEETNIDDTCFSTFSAIPEMTLFAKMGDANRQSPFKSQQAASIIFVSVCKSQSNTFPRLLALPTQRHREPHESEPPRRARLHQHLAD